MVSRLLFAFLISLGAYSYTYLYYDFPVLPKEGLKGVAYFDIASVSSSQSHFGKCWVYKGTIRSFHSEDQSAVQKVKNIPCRLVLPFKEDQERPLADRSYYIYGTLKEASEKNYLFSVKKDSSWIPLESNWSWAEYRFQVKNIVNSHIQSQIQHPRVAGFLSGIVTGDFDDRLLTSEFGRFGIQHIMAISGFHFNLLAAMLGVCFRIFFGRKCAAGLLIMALSVYFVFLGFSASVMRAWFAIIIFFGGYMEKNEDTP